MDIKFKIKHGIFYKKLIFITIIFFQRFRVFRYVLATLKGGDGKELKSKVALFSNEKSLFCQQS